MVSLSTDTCYTGVRRRLTWPWGTDPHGPLQGAPDPLRGYSDGLR